MGRKGYIMQVAKKHFIFLSDDVREEKGNKISLMGIYSDKIIFDKLPAVLPKLCIAVFLEGLKEEIPDMRVRVKNPGMKPNEIHVPQAPKKKVESNANFVFHVMPFKADASGDATIEIYFGEEDRPSITHKFRIEAREE
jgi:hypothetical protein